MNILYITPFPLEKSSTGTYIEEMARYFSFHGHNILVINIDNEKKKYERPYKVITIPFSKPYFDIEFPCFTTHPNTSNKFYSMTDNQIQKYENYLRKAFEKIIDVFKPDIIHTQYLWINSAIICDITDKPVIVTSFGNEIQTSEKNIRYQKYVKSTVENSSFIIAPSKQIEKELRDTFDLDSIRLKLIYRGYNDDIFKFIEDKQQMYREYFSIHEQCKKIVLYHDNLSHIKGIDIFMKTANNILETRNDICFIVIGKGEYSEEVKKLSIKYDRNFLYFPAMTTEEQPLINHISDLHVMPVRYEKFGIKALESLAMGTPVLTSDIGELAYFINDNNGRKLSDTSEDALKKNINEMLSNDFKKDVSFFCYQYAQRNYSKSAGLKLISKLYDYAISDE